MNKKIFAVFVLILLAISFNAFSAHAGTIFSPKQYARAAGSPNSYEDAFIACDTDKGANYLLIVENGDNAGANRLSSARINLNGADVVRQSDLNQQTGRIEKPVQLLPENNLNVSLASGPGGFVNVSIVCVSGCLEVKINSPYDNASVNKPTALVTGGLLNAYSETGVTIKTTVGPDSYSELAQSRGSAFAGIARLATGANTITATAVNTCGYSVSDTIIVNAAPSASGYVSLSIAPPSGVPDSKTGVLSVSLDATDNLKNVASYAWDYNGDNIIDATGADLSKVKVDYTSPGLYYPTVMVTDKTGNQFTETAIVNVMTKAELDALLIPKWNAMKSSLASGNVETALKSFTGKSQKMYRYNFNLLLPHLPEIAGTMNDIVFAGSFDGFANYTTSAVQNGKQLNFGVFFVRDADGIWRIKFF